MSGPSVPGAGSLRILAVAETWFGAGGDGYVRAFRRLGHAVAVVPAEEYVPVRWRHPVLRALRRVVEPLAVREFEAGVLRQTVALAPHLIFVFKGRYVTARTLHALRQRGVLAINFYPDVSFRVHGKYIPAALPVYDWVFTTKSFGLDDMRRTLGVERSSILLHSADPDVHRPWGLTPAEVAAYACDVSFIGTWSAKKQGFLEALAGRLGDLSLKVWGDQWSRATGPLQPYVQNRVVLGADYAKAIAASRINLGILSEARTGASSGDQVTSRTFHIPASGGFLLHERTDEFLALFREGQDCGAFGTAEEMVEQAHAWIRDDARRREVALAGRQRVLEAHTTDHRVRAILGVVQRLRSQAEGTRQ